MPGDIDASTRQLTQMQIEEQALMKEDDDASASVSRPCAARSPTTSEKLDVHEGQLANEKNAIDHVQDLKGQIDDAKSERSAPRATATWPVPPSCATPRFLACSSDMTSPRPRSRPKAEDGEGLKEEVTSEEIAEVVSAWTGVPVSKMMQGEIDKLKNLEASCTSASWARTRPSTPWPPPCAAAARALRSGQAHRQLLLPGPHGRGQDRARQGAGRVPVR